MPERTLSSSLPEALRQAGLEVGEIRHIRALSGGSINAAYSVVAERGQLFVKCNQAAAHPQMFEVEARGLELLRQAATDLRIPDVRGVAEVGDRAFLILEYIDENPSGRPDAGHLGRGLAQLHRHSQDFFGLDYDNYIGRLPQANQLRKDWVTFFIEMRLEPQLQLAGTNFSASDRQRFDKLFHRLEELMPHEVPALIHGDLWGGNCLADEQNRGVLIDPAVYYGHREVDLAMMQLFGGFEAAVFDRYHEHFPLEPGWRQRTELFNLYPLLVHVNLFGAGYTSQVLNVLRKYT